MFALSEPSALPGAVQWRGATPPSKNGYPLFPSIWSVIVESSADKASDSILGLDVDAAAGAAAVEIAATLQRDGSPEFKDVQRWAESRNPYLQISAARLLAAPDGIRNPSSVKVLQQMAQTSDPEIQRAGMVALALQRNEEAASVILRYIKGKPAIEPGFCYIDYLVAGLIWGFGERAAMPLEEFAASSGYPRHLRIRCIRALPRLSPQTAEKALRRLYLHPRVPMSLRSHVQQALRDIAFASKQEELKQPGRFSTVNGAPG